MSTDIAIGVNFRAVTVTTRKLTDDADTSASRANIRVTPVTARLRGAGQVAVMRPAARAPASTRPRATRYQTNGRSELLATNLSSHAIEA